MRKCKTCSAELPEGTKAVYCRACIRERRRKRSREFMQAHRVRKARKCRDCDMDISKRPNAAVYCRSCAYKRHLQSTRRAHDKHREVRPCFVYCPEHLTFDEWLYSIARQPWGKPELDREPETWQPFQVPDYLK